MKANVPVVMQRPASTKEEAETGLELAEVVVMGLKGVWEVGVGVGLLKGVWGVGVGLLKGIYEEGLVGLNTEEMVEERRLMDCCCCCGVKRWSFL